MSEQQEQQQNDQGGGNAPDYSFVPETFVKDGAPDLTAFRQHYDDLASWKAQNDEAAATIPQKADDYTLTLPENFEGLLPEGFTPPADFKLELADDPDLPELRETLLRHKAPKQMMDDLGKILAKREIRSFHQAATEHAKAMQALGPTAQSRVDGLKRAIEAKLPASEAKALLEGVALSADVVRGLERLFSSAGRPPSSPPNSPSLDGMSPAEKISFGLQQRSARR